MCAQRPPSAVRSPAARSAGSSVMGETVPTVWRPRRRDVDRVVRLLTPGAGKLPRHAAYPCPPGHRRRRRRARDPRSLRHPRDVRTRASSGAGRSCPQRCARRPAHRPRLRRLAGGARRTRRGHRRDPVRPGRRRPAAAGVQHQAVHVDGGAGRSRRRLPLPHRRPHQRRADRRRPRRRPVPAWRRRPDGAGRATTGRWPPTSPPTASVRSAATCSPTTRTSTTCRWATPGRGTTSRSTTAPWSRR